MNESLNYINTDTLIKIHKVLIEAGKEILFVYDSMDPGTEYKQDRSPVTRADRLSHDRIHEILSLTPWPVLSEEGRSIPFSERQQWETYWLVDPLDGTKEFLHRNDEFTINIALIHQHYPIGGWIYLPVSDELFLGMHSFWVGKFPGASKLQSSIWENQEWKQYTLVPPKKQVSTRCRVATSRSHLDPATRAYIQQLKASFDSVEFFHVGSSLKFCLIAEGAVDFYPRFAPTMEWDTAAGQAIAEGSGAEVINPHTGNRLSYNCKDDLQNSDFLVQRTSIP